MVTRIHDKGGPAPKTYMAEWREHRGLTQEQVANRLGTTKASVSRYETGKRIPTLGYLFVLADALSCEPADLFRDPEAPSADDLLRRASPDQQAQAIRMIEAFLKAG